MSKQTTKKGSRKKREMSGKVSDLPARSLEADKGKAVKGGGSLDGGPVERVLRHRGGG
jgi:hypothetical protein